MAYRSSLHSSYNLPVGLTLCVYIYVYIINIKYICLHVIYNAMLTYKLMYYIYVCMYKLKKKISLKKCRFLDPRSEIFGSGVLVVGLRNSYF